MAVAEAFGVDTSNLVLNVSSIQEARKKYQQEKYEAIKKLAPSLFTGLPSIIHWDGKLLRGPLRKKKVNRIAIIISCGGIEQLLGVQEVSSSSGDNQATAVFEALENWCLADNIQKAFAATPHRVILENLKVHVQFHKHY